MIALLVIVPCTLLAQGGVTIQVGGGRPDSARAHPTVMSDSAYRARAVRDSARTARRRTSVVTATPADLATAFTDTAARALLASAREARLGQDSALQSYDATTYERFTVGLSLSRIARRRVFLRYERSARVQWSREGGARVEITGERTTAPVLGGERVTVDLASVPPIPYFPGREPLWGQVLARANVSEDEIINPLAAGAERYYTYSSGDSATFRLSAGQAISIREIRVRPRSPHWSVLVASLWMDASNGRLVRAVYRMAEPLDIAVAIAEDEDGDGCEPRWLCAVMSPMTVDVPVVTVEYGLHEGLFWLPRTLVMEGRVRLGIVRVPIEFEQSYRYESVNASTGMAPVLIAVADTATDSLSRARRAEARRAACGTGEYRERTVTRFDRTLPVSIRVPCDTAALIHASSLPASAFDEAEEGFDSAERDELIRRVLDLAAQADFSPQPVRWRHWLQMLRYNRIEGLSAGLAASQSLGAGFSSRGEIRFGFADRQINGELGVNRSNGRTDVAAAVYRRLVPADDWGDPFSLGSSLAALAFGRDDAFYYRAFGAELTRGPSEGLGMRARLFVERHDSARTEAAASLARVVNDRRFRANIAADEGTMVGSTLRWTASHGLDPQRFRVLSDLRLEGAVGTFDYTRAAWDVTLSRGLGPLAGAVTGAAGTSGGTLPLQRWWFIGGPYTVRGQRPGAMRGDAFWLARAELASSLPLARPVVFGDLGWAGDRSSFSHPGQPVSGAGLGASFLDGLVRFDLAKGIRPRTTLRGYLYLEARF